MMSLSQGKRLVIEILVFLIDLATAFGREKPHDQGVILTFDV